MTIEEATIILAIVTGILALVTGIMAIATAAMAYWTRDMAAETKRSTELAAASLAHGKNVRLDSLRPRLVVLSPNDIAGSEDQVYFSFRDSPIHLQPASKIVATLDGKGHAWYSVPFKNIGHGVARITSFDFLLGPGMKLVAGEKHLTESVVSVGGRMRVSFALGHTTWQEASTYPGDDGQHPETRLDCRIELRYTNVEDSEAYSAVFSLHKTEHGVTSVQEIDTQRTEIAGHAEE